MKNVGEKVGLHEAYFTEVERGPTKYEVTPKVETIWLVKELWREQ